MKFYLKLKFCMYNIANLNELDAAKPFGDNFMTRSQIHKCGDCTSEAKASFIRGDIHYE